MTVKAMTAEQLTKDHQQRADLFVGCTKRIRCAGLEN